MSKTKFTKGEWKMINLEGKFHIYGYETGFGICNTLSSEGIDLANACLIRVAPKMYKFLDDLANGRGVDYPIEQLLAEARGER